MPERAAFRPVLSTTNTGVLGFCTLSSGFWWVWFWPLGSEAARIIAADSLQLRLVTINGGFRTAEHQRLAVGTCRVVPGLAGFSGLWLTSIYLWFPETSDFGALDTLLWRLPRKRFNLSSSTLFSLLFEILLSFTSTSLRACLCLRLGSKETVP